MQGTADVDVPVSVAKRLMAHLDGPDIRLVLLKDRDHRLSQPDELALLGQTLDTLPV